MISRKSAKLIADAYGLHFRGFPGGLKANEINNFFYEQEYEAWFLQIIRNIVVINNEPRFVTALMQLHTGETQQPATTSWDWPQRQALGQKLLKRLAEDIFRLYESIPRKELDLSKAKSQSDLEMLKRLEKYNVPAEGTLEKLKAQLELDGYIYQNGKLYPVESSVIDVQAEQSYLEQLIDSLNLSDPATIKYHIQLAEDHYVNNRNSDSIGNSRHFLEAILAQVLEQVSTKLGRNLHSNVYKNATVTRDHLVREGLLSEDEKETLKQIYGLLSNTGGHAYIAEKDQARMMWHLALTCSQFVLLRYEGFVKAHP